VIGKPSGGRSNSVTSFGEDGGNNLDEFATARNPSAGKTTYQPTSPGIQIALDAFRGPNSGRWRVVSRQHLARPLF